MGRRLLYQVSSWHNDEPNHLVSDCVWPSSGLNGFQNGQQEGKCLATPSLRPHYSLSLPLQQGLQSLYR